MRSGGWAEGSKAQQGGALDFEKGTPDVVYPGSRAWRWAQKAGWRVR